MDNMTEPDPFMVTRNLIGFIFLRNRGKHNKNLYTAVQRIKSHNSAKFQASAMVQMRFLLFWVVTLHNKPGKQRPTAVTAMCSFQITTQ